MEPGGDASTTVTILPCQLSLVHIPLRLVNQLMHPILKTWWYRHPRSTHGRADPRDPFFALCRNQLELSIFASSRIVKDNFRDYLDPPSPSRRRHGHGDSHEAENDRVMISEQPWIALEICVAVNGIEEAGHRIHTLTSPLAALSISILFLSTFSSDFILVRARDLATVITVLQQEGFDFNEDSDEEDLYPFERTYPSRGGEGQDEEDWASNLRTSFDLLDSSSRDRHSRRHHPHHGLSRSSSRSLSMSLQVQPSSSRSSPTMSRQNSDSRSHPRLESHSLSDSPQTITPTTISAPSNDTTLPRPPPPPPLPPLATTTTTTLSTNPMTTSPTSSVERIRVPEEETTIQVRQRQRHPPPQPRPHQGHLINLGLSLEPDHQEISRKKLLQLLFYPETLLEENDDDDDEEEEEEEEDDDSRDEEEESSREGEDEDEERRRRREREELKNRGIYCSIVETNDSISLTSDLRILRKLFCDASSIEGGGRGRGEGGGGGPGQTGGGGAGEEMVFVSGYGGLAGGAWEGEDVDDEEDEDSDLVSHVDSIKIGDEEGYPQSDRSPLEVRHSANPAKQEEAEEWKDAAREAGHVEIDPDNVTQDRESDSGGRTLLECLQLDLLSLGLDASGLAHHYAAVLIEGGVKKFMLQSTFGSANLLVSKKEAKRARTLLLSQSPLTSH